MELGPTLPDWYCHRCRQLPQNCTCPETYEFKSGVLGECPFVVFEKGDKAAAASVFSREDVPAMVNYLRAQIAASYGMPPERIKSRPSTVAYGGNFDFSWGSVDAGGEYASEPAYLTELSQAIPHIMKYEPTREEQLDAIFSDLHGMQPAADYRSWRIAFEKTGSDWAKTRMEMYWEPGADDYLNEPLPAPVKFDWLGVLAFSGAVSQVAWLSLLKYPLLPSLLWVLGAYLLVAGITTAGEAMSVRDENEKRGYHRCDKDCHHEGFKNKADLERYKQQLAKYQGQHAKKGSKYLG